MWPLLPGGGGACALASSPVQNETQTALIGWLAGWLAGRRHSKSPEWPGAPAKCLLLADVDVIVLPSINLAEQTQTAATFTSLGTLITNTQVKGATCRPGQRAQQTPAARYLQKGPPLPATQDDDDDDDEVRKSS